MLPAWFGDLGLLLFPSSSTLDRVGLAMSGCCPKGDVEIGLSSTISRQQADARQLTVALGHGWGCPTSSRVSLRGGTRCFQALGAARPCWERPRCEDMRPKSLFFGRGGSLQKHQGEPGQPMFQNKRIDDNDSTSRHVHCYSQGRVQPSLAWRGPTTSHSHGRMPS